MHQTFYKCNLPILFNLGPLATRSLGPIPNITQSKNQFYDPYIIHSPLVVLGHIYLTLRNTQPPRVRIGFASFSNCHEQTHMYCLRLYATLVPSSLRPAKYPRDCHSTSFSLPPFSYLIWLRGSCEKFIQWYNVDVCLSTHIKLINLPVYINENYSI